MKKIVFVLILFGMVHVADAQRITRITHGDSGINNQYPAWSPDGETIAYTSARESRTNIYLINKDGTNERLLSNDSWVGSPVWSPDGSRIAFETSGTVDIIDADGKNRITIVSDAMDPAWSPDGKELAFVRDKIGIQIFVINLESNVIRQLTTSTRGGIYPSWSPDGMKIAFESFHEPNENSSSFYSNSEIFIMNADGSDQVRLTYSDEIDSKPSWSPDGKMIAFYSNRSESWGIFVMNSDGSNQTRVTGFASGTDRDPTWSPDGKKIAFTSFRDGNGDIFVVDLTVQSTTIASPQSAYSPKWSPDGSKIAFWSYRDDRREIYTMNADGSNPLRLTELSEMYFFPVWFPDGEKILFYSAPKGAEKANIYTMNTDGSDKKKLSDSGSFADWSPDGNKILFTYPTSEGNTCIFIMNSDGTNTVAISDTSRIERTPDWSPDGNRIVFIYLNYNDSLGQFQIWSMNTDGTGRQQLTESGNNIESPQWSPDGQKISFLKRYQISLMNTDGSGQDQLTPEGMHISNYCWSPDGKKIVFVNESDGNQDLYLINSDGSGLTQLTHSLENDLAPCWSPDGTKIAYQTFVESDYTIHILDLNGPIGVNEPEISLPQSFTLSQNHPNPFNPSTSIGFTLPEAGNVRLEVFNSTGQRVDMLANGHFTAGAHTAVWNTSGRASGTYFYRLRFGGFTETKKMLLIK